MAQRDASCQTQSPAHCFCPWEEQSCTKSWSDDVSTASVWEWEEAEVGSSVKQCQNHSGKSSSPNGADTAVPKEQHRHGHMCGGDKWGSPWTQVILCFVPSGWRSSFLLTQFRWQVILVVNIKWIKTWLISKHCCVLHYCVFSTWRERGIKKTLKSDH